MVIGRSPPVPLRGHPGGDIPAGTPRRGLVDAWMFVCKKRCLGGNGACWQGSLDLVKLSCGHTFNFSSRHSWPLDWLNYWYWSIFCHSSCLYLLYSRMAESPFELLLRDLVGAAITLSTEQSKRNLRYVLADHIILTFHPVISSSTRPLRHLKENIIHHCTSLGRPVFPSTSPTTIAAQKRPLDFNTFDRLLNCHMW